LLPFQIILSLILSLEELLFASLPLTEESHRIIHRYSASLALSFVQVPDLVQSYLKGETMLDKYITHNMKFDQINEAFDLLHSGGCLRTVLTFE
jgi:Zn-dependent alcohol dehydrogenase